MAESVDKSQSVASAQPHGRIPHAPPAVSDLRCADRLTRNNAIRVVFQRLLHQHGVGYDDLARWLGYSRQRLTRCLTLGEVPMLHIGDLARADERIPGLKDALEELDGHRRIPEFVEPVSPSDALTIVSTLLQSVGNATARLLTALQYGVTASKAAEVSRDVAAVRRALNQVEAAIAVSVIEAPPSQIGGRSGR